MHDAVDAVQRAVGRRGVAGAPDDELHARGKVGGRVAVDLGLQAVEHHDVVAAGHELADEMGADESGAASHQGLHVLPFLRE